MHCVQPLTRRRVDASWTECCPNGLVVVGTGSCIAHEVGTEDLVQSFSLPNWINTVRSTLSIGKYCAPETCWVCWQASQMGQESIDRKQGVTSCNVQLNPAFRRLAPVSKFVPRPQTPLTAQDAHYEVLKKMHRVIVDDMRDSAEPSAEARSQLLQLYRGSDVLRNVKFKCFGIGKVNFERYLEYVPKDWTSLLEVVNAEVDRLKEAHLKQQLTDMIQYASPPSSSLSPASAGARTPSCAYKFALRRVCTAALFFSPCGRPSCRTRHCRCVAGAVESFVGWG